MLCANCGAESSADNHFCGKCGFALSHEDGEAAAPRYRSRHVMLRREMAILAAALILIASTVFGVWYGMFYQRSPEMVVRRFVDADLQRQFARQNQYLVDRWDSRAALSAFQAIRQQTGSSPFQNCQITGCSQSGNTAYVNVVVSFTLPSVPGVNTPLNAAAPPGPTSVPFAFVLLSDHGDWKIDGSQTLVNASGALAAVGYTQIAPLMNGIPNVTLPTSGIRVPGVPPPTPPSSTTL
jgi:hypothetical protein